jgi:hypothetical protein
MRHVIREIESAAGALRRRNRHRFAGAVGVLLAWTAGAAAQAPSPLPFIPNYIVTSTVPNNGDLNPYGVAFVPADFPAGGTIAPFDVLVSNFNNAQNAQSTGNLQGTGTTIIDYPFSPGKAIASPATTTPFFQSMDKNVTGLDTGLAVLRAGFVLVSFLPSTDGTFATHTKGGILVLDKSGNVMTTVNASSTNQLNSPWDMTILDQKTSALAFVSNVGDANDNGFVIRFNLSISKSGVTFGNPTMVASGYGAQLNSTGFVTGPTGLVYDPATDILYVASTNDNAVFAVTAAGTRMASAGRGTIVFNDTAVLRGPLGMAQAPNGDLIVANSDLFNNSDLTHPSEYVEFTKNGTQPGTFVSQFNIDVNQGGAFGIAIGVALDGAPRLAVVDDNASDLNVFSTSPDSDSGQQ